MTLELLYFDGCPNHEALLPHLEQLLRGTEIGAEIRLQRIADDTAAQHERFLGSPTIRVGGRDVEPGADDRDAFVLACRVYQTEAGIDGQPSDAWIRAALR